MVGRCASDGRHSLNADGRRFAPGLGECGKFNKVILVVVNVYEFN